MHFNVVIFGVTAFCMLYANAQNYCEICPDHTMCKYPGLSSACGTPLSIGLDGNAKQAIVDAHNEARNIVAMGLETKGNPGPQPSASNMRKMIWDDEIAAIAQRWVEQCTYGHDTCRNSARFYVGQNGFLLSSTAIKDNYDVASNVDGWFSEVDRFDPRSIEPFQFLDAGHYTQAAWAESYLVGCGFISYPSGWYQYWLICNYGPGGNIIGGSMYKTGNPASNCPAGTSQDAIYPGLCS